MGDRQAHRAVNEQVAGRGRRRSRRAAVVAGCRAGCSASCGSRRAPAAVRAVARTDRLVAWREERSSRQVFWVGYLK